MDFVCKNCGNPLEQWDAPHPRNEGTTIEMVFECTRCKVLHTVTYAPIRIVKG